VDESMATLQSIVQDEYPAILKGKLGEMRRAKLGLKEWDDEGREELWDPLMKLMTKSGADYTIFFRQLAEVSDAQAAAAGKAGSPAALSATDPMLALLGMAFDDEGKMEDDLRGEWCSWLGQYARRLDADAMGEGARRAVMKAGSPKFIPREWMLVEAYQAAEKGDFSVLTELQGVFASPFDEHTPELTARYFKRAPAALVKKAGVGYFS